MLELDEEGYDANLLRLTLEEVVEARKQLGDFSEVGQQHFEKLDRILVETGGQEILALIEFLDICRLSDWDCRERIINLSLYQFAIAQIT